MLRAYLDSPAFRRRAPALAFALAIEALLLLALLAPIAYPLIKKRESSLITIPLQPPPPPPTVARAKSQVKQKQDGGSAPPKHIQPPTPTPPRPPSYIELSRSDFAAGDISKLSRSEGQGTEGKGNAAAYGPGEGPGGAPLYNAEWYVEPTPGQLALYLPKGGPRPGSAMIICQTLPAYRVDNCRSLGESPPGSGLASALRQAAWQFKVVPPRQGGKPIIGAWVRIRFDWYERGRDRDELVGAAP